MQAISAHLTGHGGRLDEAARLYPDAAQPWLDLSTGINPVAWAPASPLDVDARALPATTDLRALEAAAAQHFAVDPARVAAVPGSEIALRLLPALGLPPVACVTPAYATHRAVAAHALEAPAEAPGKTLLLANPNNPDGRLLAPEALLDLADRQARTGGWLIVDEAFADAVPGSSILPALGSIGVGHVNPFALSVSKCRPASSSIVQQEEGRCFDKAQHEQEERPFAESRSAQGPDAPVIVLRSFGKVFGLAGLRLGFVVAAPDMIARLRHCIGDWPVSAHALAYGRAAYGDPAWIAATAATLPKQAAALDALLARHGLAAQGACPLFRLVETPDAAILFDRLARAGILVRPFADQPGWLRFGLPADESALARLDRALAGG